VRNDVDFQNICPSPKFGARIVLLLQEKILKLSWCIKGIFVWCIRGVFPSNLARSLSGQGKHAEAEEMLHEVLAVRKRVLGAEHPDTLAAASDMLQATRKRAAEGAHACADASKRRKH